MRNHIIRAALVTFFAALSVFGGGAVQFHDGIASVQFDQVSARTSHDLSCEWYPDGCPRFNR